MLSSPMSWRPKVTIGSVDMNDVVEELLKTCKGVTKSFGGDPLTGRLHSLGMEALQEKGLPSVKDDRWKHTSLKSLRGDYTLNGGKKDNLNGSLPPLINQRVVFLNGRFNSSLSNLGAGCSWGRIQNEKDIEDLTEHMKDQDGFMAMAMAFCRDIWKIEIEKEFDEPLGLYHFFDESFEGMMSHPLLFIEVKEKSRCHIFETSCATSEVSSGFYNIHHIFKLHPKSKVEHVQTMKMKGDVMNFCRVLADVQADACYRHTMLNLGGNFLRSNPQVKLLEQGAETSLNGLYVHEKTEGSSHCSSIEHKAQKTTSHQLYKGLLDDSSQASFHGTIVVDDGCSDIESEQLNKNVLLSKKASVHSSPQLEIGNCDVKCTHGSTVGELSSDEIFYLQTRGFSDLKARQVLAGGFCQDVVEEINDSPLRALGQDYLSEFLGEKSLFRSEL